LAASPHTTFACTRYRALTALTATAIGRATLRLLRTASSKSSPTLHTLHTNPLHATPHPAPPTTAAPPLKECVALDWAGCEVEVCPGSPGTYGVPLLQPPNAECTVNRAYSYSDRPPATASMRDACETDVKRHEGWTCVVSVQLPIHLVWV